MKEFDPAKPSLVHDALNDKKFLWQPEWAPHFREHAIEDKDGVVGWDGLLLDGWEESIRGSRPRKARPGAPTPR
jgi:hypothetical protein